MKKEFILFLLFVGCVLAGGHAVAADPADYLKLTLQNLPHMQVVIQAAVDNMDISKEPLPSLKRKLRASALVPTLTVNANLYEDAVNEYGWVNNSRTYTAPGNVQVFDGWGQTGEGDDRLNYGVTLSWDLSNLVWRNEESTYSTILARRTSNIRRRVEEVGERYVLLSAVLPEDSTGSIAPGKEVTALQHALYLDEMTGGLLSGVLRRNAVEK